MKRYCGVCEGCRTLQEAKRYEAEKIALIKKLGEQETVEALEVNFKRELGNNIEIPLPARKQPNPTSQYTSSLVPPPPLRS